MTFQLPARSLPALFSAAYFSLSAACFSLSAACFSLSATGAAPTEKNEGGELGKPRTYHVAHVIKVNFAGLEFYL